MNRKFVFGIMLALLATVLVASVAMACHAALVVQDNGCENVTLVGTYVDDDRLFKGVRIYVDGAKVAENGAWSSSEMQQYSISTSYTITDPGSHTVVVKGYDYVTWTGVSTYTQTVEVSECPPPPVDCQVSDWSEWGVCADGVQTRTRTVTTEPANGGLACPALTETQSCETPPTDLCTNLDGVQATMPEGYEDPDQDGVCTVIETPPADACPNIEGDQETVPEGMVLNEKGECVTPYQPPYVPTCDPSKKIWVWTMTDANGIAYTLRDLGYDGTYDSPGVAQQCFYFGCDFHAVKAAGRWVNECDSAYDYWRELPRFAGGGKCSLPEAPSQ